MSLNETKFSSRKLLEMIGIHKYFGRIHVLRGIDFYANKGEVVGLVGDNGAGKSTLIKIISGYHKPDKGKIYFNGRKEVKILSPSDARVLGIETVYQEQALAPNLSISRNIFMGREPVNVFGFIRKEVMNQESAKALKSIGLNLRSTNIAISSLSGGERQGVAMSRVVYFKARLVILDEPTAALSVDEVNKVLEFIRELKRKGIAVIFITHNINHIFSIADRIIVLSHGLKIADMKKDNTSTNEIEKIIVSRPTGK